MPNYRVNESGLQDRFLKSRAKIRIFGGGFGNGKTAACCVLALQLAKEYPGSNGLIARATYPKLIDTIRKEFIKWCPPKWIKSFPKSQNSANTCTLENGSQINFRYVAQTGKTEESTTSNLLSATYDWIIIDQMEDPEIVHKDFLDLLGRLRGSAPYIGDDPTMPRSGPRWFIATVNPTRNWIYTKLVRPVHEYLRTGKRSPDLLWDEQNGVPLIEVYEGSTYENADNLDADFIQTLETVYQGQMRDRFLLGKWAAYEGLVYPQFDDAVHVVPYEAMRRYATKQRQMGVQVRIIEGYDYGTAVPSCYLIVFTDMHGNVHVLDGFYQAEMLLEDQAAAITKVRLENALPINQFIYADPSIFRRGPGGGTKLVGRSVADMLADPPYRIQCTRANNAIHNGIIKVQSYLNIAPLHRNPYTGDYPAPRIYFSDRLTWLFEEITDYYWKKDPQGNREDNPRDGKDHAMDTLRYLLTDLPTAAPVVPIVASVEKPAYLRGWGENNIETDTRMHRYG
jgi:phage terminase large subunit